MTGVINVDLFRLAIDSKLAGPAMWIRLTDPELRLMGGPEHFAGCQIVSENVTCALTSQKAAQYHREGGKYRFAWKVIAPKDGWHPPSTTTDEGKTRMEHHIDRSKLIEVVTQNKEAYDLVLKRAQALYRDEIEKKTEEHVQGLIPSNQIMVSDKNGQITVPTDMTDTFDKQLRALDLDSREVIILDDGEYLVYVESQATNLANLAAVTKRLEEL